MQAMPSPRILARRPGLQETLRRFSAGLSLPQPLCGLNVAPPLSPAEIGEPETGWQGLDAMDGGQRRNETGRRVEPTAGRRSGGERSAKHRFHGGPRGL